jgi:hypothetical protein
MERKRKKTRIDNPRTSLDAIVPNAAVIANLEKIHRLLGDQRTCVEIPASTSSSASAAIFLTAAMASAR